MEGLGLKIRVHLHKKPLNSAWGRKARRTASRPGRTPPGPNWNRGHTRPLVVRTANS